MGKLGRSLPKFAYSRSIGAPIALDSNGATTGNVGPSMDRSIA
jgi:hypothetical protein